VNYSRNHRFFEKGVLGPMGTAKKFSFKELSEMDGGRIALAVDRAIKRVAEDCEDVPGEKQKRTVNLQIEMKPVLDPAGFCERVDVAIQVKEKVPTRKSRVYDFGLRKNGVLTYQPDALDDHKQDTLPFEDER
jgi:hypothetical protein